MLMLYVVLALQGVTPTHARTEALVASVLCAEAGSSDPGGADSPRASAIAHLINFRVRARRRAGIKETFVQSIRAVLTAPHQFQTHCRVPPEKYPAWLKHAAKLLVHQKVHILSKPDWLTEDVLYFTSAAEPPPGTSWRSKLCHVKTYLGLRFEKVCGPGSATSSAQPTIPASKTSKKKRWKKAKREKPQAR